MRFFRKCYFRRNAAGSSQALMMLSKSQDGDTDKFIIFRVQNFASAYVSNIMIIYTTKGDACVYVCVCVCKI